MVTGSFTDKTDVLNRLSSAESLRQTVTLLQYMFPRQFGLPNVFTSKTPQGLLHRPFRLEDQETPKIPKRLRGTLVELVQGLQRRNRHCAYTELLRYYCPDVCCHLYWTLLTTHTGHC